MSTYVAFDNQTQISGRFILSAVEALGPEVSIILQRHGLLNIQTDKWYPQQAWLDALMEMMMSRGNHTAALDLFRVGIRVAENIELPGHIRRVDDLVNDANWVFENHYRNGTPGSVTASFTGPQRVRVVVRSPHPGDFLMGMIYGMAKRLVHGGGDFAVREDKEVRASIQEDDIHIFELTW
jgi:hypothetical protein